MKPRDLARLSVGDTLDLEGADSPLLLGGIEISPLSLLSPNQGPTRGGGLALSPPRATKPATPAVTAVAATGAAAGGASVLPPDDEVENEPLGALPQLGGGRRVGGRRPDPRRQSLAISQLFAGLSSGDGLLGDSELAVGDEDIQVPLAKSAKLLGGAANHSSLFCDPDTCDLLDTELPSPHLAGIGSSGDTGAGGAQCDSPVLAPAIWGAASTRRTPAMRASTVVFGDLRKACEEQGFDDFDGGDFQLQDSNKVRELAFLFKMDGQGPASAAATPRSSDDAARKPLEGISNLRSSADADANGGLDDIQQRLQHQGSQQCSGVGLRRQAVEQEELQQVQEEQLPAQQRPEPVQGVAAPAAGTGLPQAASVGDVAIAPCAPIGAPPPQPQQQEVQPIAQAPPPAQSPAAPRARGLPPTAAVATVPAVAAAVPAKPATAGTSRLPAPPARASRLRPPTTSSGFFSSAATSSRQPPHMTAPGEAAGRRAAAGSIGSRTRPSMRNASAGSKDAGEAAGSVHLPAPQRVAKPAERPAAAAAKAPVPSRLVQSNNSRIPTPSKSAPPAQEAGQLQRGAMFSQRTINAAAARQRAAGATAGTPAATAACPAGAAAAVKRGTPAGPARVPALHLSASPAGGGLSANNMTPNTARLRWLEQNPELAFGGGNKLVASPANSQAAAQPASKKLTAEERHLMEWQAHL